MTPGLVDHLADHATPEVASAVAALALAAADVAAQLAAPADDPTQAADAAFAARLAGRSVGLIASRARSAIGHLDAVAPLALALDPLEGAAGLAANAPAGTLFALYPTFSGAPEASFLQPGTAQLVAGCFLYGPRCTLMLALGGAAAAFTLDPTSGAFQRTMLGLRIPAATPEFAANIADYRRWDPPLQRFTDDCLAGAEGPRAADHDLRWTGSLAADAQRILLRGGVFLAPPKGGSVLRLIHHARPLALLAEAAGGRATDGRHRILDRMATTLDTTSPLVFGSSDLVDRVVAYHDLPDSETSPLFGKRGLFRF